MDEIAPGIEAPDPDASRDWPMPEAHPLAGIFPPLTGDELRQLVADIRENGLREAIVLHDNRILDGRARATACWQACVRPIFRTYDGPDPLAYIISANLHRRHLNSSQRALVAARLADLKVGRPAAGKQNSANLQNFAGVSVGRAAQQLAVSARIVNSARAVLEHGDAELVRAVEADAITVSAAAIIARLPPAEQAKVIGERLGKEPTHNKGWEAPAELMALVREVLMPVGVLPPEQATLQPWSPHVLVGPPRTPHMAMLLVRKLTEEQRAGRMRQAILILPNRTDAPWFQAAVEKCAAICLVRGDSKIGEDGGETRSPASGHALLYYGSRRDQFVRTFRPFGAVLSPATEYGSSLLKLTEIPPSSSGTPEGHHVH
jgi:hypothetical protein